MSRMKNRDSRTSEKVGLMTQTSIAKQIKLPALLASLLLFLTLAPLAQADPVKLYLAKDYYAAYAEWEVMANNGDRVAQYNLGVMDLDMKGPLADLTLPGKWFEKSCSQNMAVACFDLALLHEIGFGVIKDSHAAFKFASKAAELGSSLGQNKLGEYYGEGFGVAGDKEKSLYWYKLSAESGEVASMNSLGVYYKEEAHDLEKAIEWFEKAASTDLHTITEKKKRKFLDDGMTLNNLRGMGMYVDTDSDEALYIAQHNLGIVYDRVNSPYQDRKKARAWYERAAQQGYADAQFNLAYLYYAGQGGSEDFDKAFYWFSQASKQNIEAATFNVAIMQLNGKGTRKDTNKAIEALKDTYGDFKPDAYDQLGDIYFNGEGVKKDEQQGGEWYAKAAELGSTPAQRKLGHILGDKKSKFYNPEESFYYYEKAANGGDAEAQYETARRYLSGEGVEKDLQKSSYWMRQASENGNDAAAKFLEESGASHEE